MKILVMDEVKSRKNQIAEALEKGKHKVVQCSGSNEFLTAMEEQSPHLVCLDFDTWNHGRSIYNYFKIPKRIEQMPLIVYNSPQTFPRLPTGHGTTRTVFLLNRAIPKQLLKRCPKVLKRSTVVRRS